METLLQDVRYGARLLVRSPGFTVVTLIALALGIGANTTVFSVANALLLRPLPVHEPDRLVRIFSNRHSNTALPTVLDFGRATRTLDGVVALQSASLSLRVGQGAPEPLFGEMVSGDYFDQLGVRAAIGRTFLASEARRPGQSPVIVLGHRFWQRRFASDPGVVGRDVIVNGQPFTVIGVAPASFTGMKTPLVPEVWVPLMMEPVLHPRSDLFTNRAQGGIDMVGRMRPGVTVAQVQAEFDTINRDLQRAFPETRGDTGVTVYPARTIVPEGWNMVAGFVALLFTLSAIVLLIACLNVASLLLARSSARVGELGIRLAIGAGRGRLIRQLLTESALLAIGGGLMGLALAFWLTRLIAGFAAPAPVPIAFLLTPDWRVLVVTLGVSLVCAVVCGLAPALAASRGAVVAAMRQDATRGAGHGRSRLRALFLVTQVSLSLVLIVVSALLVQSVVHAARVDVGFRQEQVLAMTLDLDVRNYTPERGRVLYRDLTERVKALPGVRTAHVLDIVPLTLSNRVWQLRPEGAPAPTPGQPSPYANVALNAVAPGHFDTLTIPRLAGRDFDPRDTATAPPVAIVNETLARRLWPGESPIGKRVRMTTRNDDAPPMEVVGLVKDSKYVSVGEERRSFLYRPLEQDYTPRGTLLARVDGAPAAFAGSIRQVLRGIDPDLPVFDARPLTEATSISLLPIRLAAAFLGGLGLLVLALAAVGLYGVLSFLVRLRTKEIGIRMALGADRWRVVRTILGDAMRWIAWGLGTGLIAALLLTPLAASLLYGVAPRDALTFASASALLIAVGAAACTLPAWRASRVDPLAALRTE